MARNGASASLLASAGFAADHDTTQADGRSRYMLLLEGAPGAWLGPEG